MIKRIGYACICMSLSDSVPKKHKVLTSRTLRLSKFSIPNVSKLILANVYDLFTILKWNEANKIKLFRISSEIFPFMDHTEHAYSIDDLPDAQEIKSKLAECGLFAKNNGMRLTSHPGPYNCLGSPNEFTVKKTLLSLEMHRLLGELLGLDDFVINIHVGGSYNGDFTNTANRFVSNFGRLSGKAQQWLTIENDDKASLWTVTKLYDHIHSKTGIPIIIDLHHWLFCNEETVEDAFKIAMSTWNGKIPKIHYSESAEGKRPQAHSDYIQNKLIDYCAEIEYDVMFEAKQKEKAVLEYRKKYNVTV